jgi:hypothetical protein
MQDITQQPREVVLVVLIGTWVGYMHHSQVMAGAAGMHPPRATSADEGKMLEDVAWLSTSGAGLQPITR